jgi:hypothetical protein
MQKLFQAATNQTPIGDSELRKVARKIFYCNLQKASKRPVENLLAANPNFMDWATSEHHYLRAAHAGLEEQLRQLRQQLQADYNHVNTLLENVFEDPNNAMVTSHLPTTPN